jgi:hypothetical protein
MHQTPVLYRYSTVWSTTTAEAFHPGYLVVPLARPPYEHCVDGAAIGSLTLCNRNRNLIPWARPHISQSLCFMVSQPMLMCGPRGLSVALRVWPHVCSHMETKKPRIDGWRRPLRHRQDSRNHSRSLSSFRPVHPSKWAADKRWAFKDALALAKLQNICDSPQVFLLPQF